MLLRHYLGFMALTLALPADRSLAVEPAAPPRLAASRARAYLQPYLRDHPEVARRYHALRRFLVGAGGLPELILEAGQTIAFLVRDASGEPLGVLKPTVGNTHARSEVFHFRLALLLGVPQLVTQASSWGVPADRLPALRDLVRARRYQGAKERARTSLLRQLEARIRSAASLPVAVKAWRPAVTYWRAAGHQATEGFDPRGPLAPYLLAGGPRPASDRFEIRQGSRFAPPLGRYRGWGRRPRLVAELGGIMLLDALASDGDRFPGGNLHVRALSGRVTTVQSPDPEVPGSRRHGVHDLGEISFLALDNGSGLGRVPVGSARGLRTWERHVSRVDRGMAERLRGLHAFLQGEAPNYREFQDPEVLAAFLGLGDTKHPYWALLGQLIRRVVGRLDALAVAHPGEESYFRHTLQATFSAPEPGPTRAPTSP